MQDPVVAIAAPPTKALQEIGWMLRYGCLVDESGERQLWMDFGVQFKSSLTYSPFPNRAFDTGWQTRERKSNPFEGQETVGGG